MLNTQSVSMPALSPGTRGLEVSMYMYDEPWLAELGPVNEDEVEFEFLVQ